MSDSERSGAAFGLSHGQRALWFVHSLSPESIAYQGMYVWRIRGDVDSERLERALDRVAARHPALRTTLEVSGDGVRQRVHADSSVRLERIDASGWSDAELRRRMDEEAERPYDLERGPFVRPRLYSRSPSDHRLLLAIHHIVLDHWSIAGIVHEMEAFYRRPDLELAPPGATYQEFVEWQADMLAGRRGEKLAAYWQERLAGDPPPLDLPTDRPRPTLQTFRGGSLIHDLDPRVVEALQAYANRRGATLFMVLLAAFQVLLHRLTGQDDIVVGTPMAGRSQPGFERVVGYFTNLVPMRADLSAAPTFDELVGEVRGDALDALEHQDYPFSLMVERLGVARDPSRAPLTDVIFAWEGSPPMPPASPGDGPSLEMELTTLRQLGAAVDTAWSAFHRNGSLALAIQYNVDLFDAAGVAAMAAHFSELLAGIVADPSRRVSELPLLGEEERRRVLEQWQGPRRGFPAERSFAELLAERVAATPDLPAVEHGDRRLTYRQLDAEAERLARRLVGLGVGREVRVGVCAERRPELIVAMIAAWKAGGAFVPLDPAYPAERLDFMISDSGLRVLLTTSELAGDLPAGEVPTVLLDAPEVDAGQGELPTPPAPGDLAYVIYTSGSTGTPKGVMVPHRGLVNVSEEQGRTFGPGEGSRVLQFASLSFDASVWELVMALRRGGTLVLADREEMLPGAPLARLLEERRIGLVTLPPSALAATEPAPLPELETIMVAGERCPADVVRRWAPGRRFFNLYGPTEATIWSSFAELTAADEQPPTLGRPIGNTELYVLDRRLAPVPVGVAGELVIGGEGVTRGYLDRPRLTAERFVPDPFSGAPGSRLYRSGDRVRRLRDGRLDFLGRLDHQVKLRGYRIELGEVEEVLRADEGVREAVAVILGEGREAELVAYVSGGEELPSADALKAALRRRVPEYMVPRWIVRLPELPHTPSGKVDRSALPAPRPSAAGAAGGAPQHGLEGRIAAIWREVLDVDEVGLEDNFFDLGGHSLLLGQVHARLEATLDRKLNVSVLFQYPTVAALARHLGGEGEEEDAGPSRAEARRRAASRRRRRG